MRRSCLLLAACLAGLACEQDPARSVKIIARPVTPSQPVGAPASGAQQVSDIQTPPPSEAAAREPRAAAARPPKDTGRSVPAPGQAANPPREAASETTSATAWRPPGCPPPPEASSGPSNFIVSGPCAFEHRTEVACESLEDDFLVTLTRKAAGGSTLMVFINVEFYKGPGEYTGAQAFLGLQDKTNIYRWSSDTMKATVGKNEESITIPETRLDVEPMFLNCTGTMRNFQCQDRGAMAEIPLTTEVVSGTLRCQAPKVSAKQ